MKIDKNMLIDIIKMKEKDLIKFLSNCKDCKRKGNYFWLWLKSPELPYLVAHIDTVYGRNRNIEIVHNDKYIWSPQGIGGDDRCGVYALIELFDKLNINCLFTDYEERGGLGAKEFVETCKDLLDKIPYMIEIDRRNYREAVFYNFDDENLDFLHPIEKYFYLKFGSFSDIAIIGKYANCCSVNLSAGFVNEHSGEAEFVVIPYLEYTISKIPKLLEELGNKKYELPDYEKYNGNSFSNYSYYEDPYYYEDLIFDEVKVKLVDGSFIKVSSYDELEDLLLAEEITEDEYERVLDEVEEKTYLYYAKQID